MFFLGGNWTSSDDSETRGFLNILGNYLITNWQEEELRRRLAENSFGTYDIDTPKTVTLIKKYKDTVIKLDIKMTREKMNVPPSEEKEMRRDELGNSGRPVVVPRDTGESGRGMTISGVYPDFSFGGYSLDPESPE